MSVASNQSGVSEETSLAQSAGSDVSMLHEWGEENRRRSKRFQWLRPGTLRGSNMIKLHTHAKRTLAEVGTRIEDAVQLPDGEDLNEWLAMHTVDFYNEITLLYAIVAELDTDEKFPVMGAGKNKYLWADNTTVEPLKLSAPAYVNRLFEWIEDQLNDEDIFPTSFDQAFPSNFKARVSRIFRRLFRVYAHIYYAHFEYIVEQKVEAHMNSCFKHFVIFSRAYGLVGGKEMEPLKYVIDQLVGTGGGATEDEDPNAEAYGAQPGDDDGLETGDAGPDRGGDTGRRPKSVSGAIRKDRDQGPPSAAASPEQRQRQRQQVEEQRRVQQGKRQQHGAVPTMAAAAARRAEEREAAKDVELQEKGDCCVIL